MLTRVIHAHIVPNEWHREESTSQHVTRASGRRLEILHKDKDCGNIIITTLCLHAIAVVARWMLWAAGSPPYACDALRDGSCWVWRQKRSPVSFGRVKGTDMRSQIWGGSEQKSGIEFLSLDIFSRSVSSSVCTNTHSSFCSRITALWQRRHIGCWFWVFRECLWCGLRPLCCPVLAAISFRPGVYTGIPCLQWAVCGLWPECGEF